MATVYVVDHDNSVRRALTRLFRSANLRVTSFPSVKEFLETDMTNDAACVIADIRMPESDGLELPALLNKCGHKVPVIFLSAQDAEHARLAAKQAGAAGYFRKPVDARALLDAIAWAIREENGEDRPSD